MNELNVLKRICRHLWLALLLCAVSAATASAQVLSYLKIYEMPNGGSVT